MAATQIKDGFQGGSDNQLKVNTDGSINVNATGGGGGGNASVGATDVVAPVFGTEIAGIDPDGNLKAVSVDENGFVNVQGVSTVTGPVTTEQAGLDAFQTSQYSVGLTAVQLTPTPLANRSSISLSIIAEPNIAVYIGNSNSVTIHSGYPLFNGNTLEMDLTPTGQIWVISEASDQTVAVLEIA